jgi:hypothetical protein
VHRLRLRMPRQRGPSAASSPRITVDPRAPLGGYGPPSETGAFFPAQRPAAECNEPVRSGHGDGGPQAGPATHLPKGEDGAAPGPQRSRHREDLRGILPSCSPAACSCRQVCSHGHKIGTARKRPQRRTSAELAPLNFP